MPPTISPDEQFALIIEADARRRASRRHLHPHRPSEVLFNVPGWLLGVFWSMLPFAWRRKADLWFCRRMGGHPPEPNPELAIRRQQCVELALAMRKKTGCWPAVLGAITHPPTEGPLQWLRFEILAQALEAAFDVCETRRQAEEGTRIPQCLLAVDPYALDSVPLAVGAAYAAYMRRLYVTWDRQSASQHRLQRLWFLRGTRRQDIAWQLLRRMQEGTPVLMAFGGGLPANARLLYAAREFIQQLTLPAWKIPKRVAEQRFMQALLPHEGTDPAGDGIIPAATRTLLLEQLRALGLDSPAAEQACSRFEEEFAREVPWRTRLLTLLVKRLARNGQALLFLPLEHRDQTPHIRFDAPWALRGGSEDSIEAWRPGEEMPQRLDLPALARAVGSAFV